MNHRAVRLAGILLVALALATCGQAPASGGQPSGSNQVTSSELNLLCTPQVEWCEGMKAEFEKANPGIYVLNPWPGATPGMRVR